MGAQHFQPLTAEDPTGVPGYRISARLGGRVYLAHAPGGIPVALRLIDRLPPDVHALRQVHGPYVVPFVDGGADDSGAGPWLATAYVPGLSLRTAVTTTGPLPVPSVLRLVAGIAEALRTIHHRGLTHAALTPAHVLLAADGPRVKDFALTGVAASDTSAAASSASRTVPAGAAEGSPAQGPAPVSLMGEHVADEPPAAAAFLAPEQVAGKAGGPAADVFSLGLIAAYAAVGGAAVGGGEADLNELPGELREIVTRCLIKDPALRPSPAQIIAMCAQAAPDASRRRADRWLPPALLAAIVPAMPPPAPPIPVAPPTGHPGSLHYGWARPSAGHVPYRPHLPHLPHLPRPPARRRGGTVLAAVAALAVVAAVGAVLLDRSDDDHRASGASTASTAPAAAPTTSPPDSGAGGGDATGAPEQPSGTRYAGIRLPAGSGLSLTQDPPVVLPGPFTGDIGFTPEPEAFGTDPAHGTVALLDPAAPDTLAGCRGAAAASPSIPRDSVSAGSRVCVQSADGTVALVVFRALTPKGAPAPSASLDVTVWRTEGRSAEANQDGIPNPQALGTVNLAHFSKTV
ncbi:hypothetical protein ACIOC1_21465 [Streptomyces sp. NPDC088197]|uniref:protein kinase domain-containing protein n=1 Tax=Streptomyces sp. NPDC088197 TaxID=3365840 RepID=UPI00382431D9